MPELPIYPEKREAPGYVLERRLARLKELPSESYQRAMDGLRERSARETLRLSGGRPDDDSELVDAVIEALGRIESAAARSREPSVALVHEVHRLANPGSDGSFRNEDIASQFRNARPSPPRFITAKLDNLLQWLSGESGRDMFPAERMALWFARFVEIAPFEHGNFRTAHLLLTFFARAAGYPPVSLELEHAEAVREEIERALRFDTAPLVERFSEAISHSLRRCEVAAERDRS